MKQVELRANGTKRVYTKNEEPSKTDQQWKKSCDVNEIIKRFKKTGQINHLAKNRGMYADMSELPDLMTALNTVQRANEAFQSLPAHIRKYFSNDPNEMVTFLQNQQNDEEAIRLGLKVRKEQPKQDTQPQQTEPAEPKQA